MPTLWERAELLRHETLDESLQSLSDADWFCFTHQPNGYSADVPLSAEAGMEDTLIVLSNRRVLKLHDDLGTLDEPRAAEVLSKTIRYQLGVYRDLFSHEVYENLYSMYDNSTGTG